MAATLLPRPRRRLVVKVGTGVLIGAPFQTAGDLADDLLFFRQMDVDMIGMGPYIPHPDTPLAKSAPDFDPQRQLDLGLKMIALARLLMSDVNIAATTALETLQPDGKLLGLQAGANIIMPNLTPERCQPAYRLYQGKPLSNMRDPACLKQLLERIESTGEKIGLHEWGDSPHFTRRAEKQTGGER